MYSDPIAYFITFTTHGTWLHGDERGSIVVDKGIPKKFMQHPGIYEHEYNKLKSPPVILDSVKRKIVFNTIIKHCQIRHWHLFAVHVRSNHVHIIIKLNKPVHLAVKELKSWSTRMLRQNGFEIENVWTAGSSRKLIFTDAKLKEKIHYVIYEQGEMMEYFIEKAFAK